MSFILSIVPIVSLFMTIRYQFITNKLASLRQNKADIQKYSLDLISTIQKYINTRARYLEERDKIKLDLKEGKEIDSGRSAFVYNIKDRYLGYKTEVKYLSDLAEVTLPVIEYPAIHKSIKRLIRNIRVYEEITDNMSKDPLYIDKYRDSANRDVDKLMNEFSLIQQSISIDIMNENSFLPKAILKRKVKNEES